MPAITFYVNPVDKAKLRKLAESRGITMTKLSKNIIADWCRRHLKSEDDEEEYE
jgi:acyl-CoA synthetase (AMP-forming)/AMP-acid ligase II